LLAGSASAQSAFEGFYGQLAVGYETNQATNLGGTGTQPGSANETWTTSNQNFNGMPLVLGLGYNWSLDSNWMLGLGADYSFLSVKSGTYTSQVSGGSTASGVQLQTSNRTNIYVTPGYAIAKDKLVYAKAGYSTVNLQETMPTSYTNPSKGTGGTLAFPNVTNAQQGYIIGVSYKQMIADGFYGFAEANYMSYGKTTFNSTNANSSPANYTFSNNPSLQTIQGLVGVGYKF